MTQAHNYEPSTRPSGGWAGWITFAAVILTLREPTLPAKILTALTQSPIYYQFAAGFVMLIPSVIVIFVIRRYLLGLWGRVVK